MSIAWKHLRLLTSGHAGVLHGRLNVARIVTSLTAIIRQTFSVCIERATKYSMVHPSPYPQLRLN